MTTNEPGLSAADIEYWRHQVTRRPFGEGQMWPDEDVMALVRRLLATLDATRASTGSAGLDDAARALVYALETGVDDDAQEARAELIRLAAARLPDLSAAWRDVEEALPEGWRLASLSPIGEKWHVIALGPHTTEKCDHGSVHNEYAKATALEPTPADALNALAAALLEQQPETGR